MIDSVPIYAGEADAATTMRAAWPFLAPRAALAGIAAALAITGWILDLHFLPWPLAVFALIGFGSVARAMRRVHLGGEVPVKPVSKSGRALLVLGVIVAVAIFVLPDHPGGWIGGPTAASIPQACKVLTPQIVADFGVRGPEPMTTSAAEARSAAYTVESGCSWARPDGGEIVLTYDQYSRHGLHSGQDEAQRAVDGGVRNVRLSRQVTQAPDATANAHHISGPLFTGPGVPAGSTAYVTGSAVGNVVVSVALLGPFGIDQFSSLVQTAAAAITIG